MHLLTDKIQKIITNYYMVLTQEIERSLENPTQQSTKDAVTRIAKEFNQLWQFSEFGDIANREEYLKKIQEKLLTEGFYLDITPQYGVDTGGLDLETVDNISLRPVLSRAAKRAKIGNQEIEYTESFLGGNLIELPDFIEPIIEAASPTEIIIFPQDLYKTLERDCEIFKEYAEEAEKRFVPGDQTADNLFCVQLKLYEKQWGRQCLSSDAQKALNEHFRLHGQQHVADFRLINSGEVAFNTDEMQVSPSLGKDMILEARVMIRQLLEQSLPYYVLGQIITFKREWLDGSRSEYAWAGHILFEGLSNKWGLGIEKMSKDEISSLAYQFAYKNRNFVDMLTAKELKDAQNQ